MSFKDMSGYGCIFFRVKCLAGKIGLPLVLIGEMNFKIKFKEIGFTALCKPIYRQSALWVIRF
jgi:hypothetical protein